MSCKLFSWCTFYTKSIDIYHIQCNIFVYQAPSIVHIRQIKKPHFKALQFVIGDHTHHINHYSSQNIKIIW